ALRPRAQGLASAVAERDTAERRVSLRERGAVFSREGGLSGRAATEGAIKVRPSRRGATLDDDQPVRREDKRRHLTAELLGRLEPGPVQRRALGGAGVENHVHLER